MTIISIGIKKEEFEKLPDNKGYVNVTVMVNDELDKFNNNVSVQVSQTEEERKAKVPKKYLGNGKVVWTKDGTIKTAKDCAPAGAKEPF